MFPTSVKMTAASLVAAVFAGFCLLASADPQPPAEARPEKTAQPQAAGEAPKAIEAYHLVWSETADGLQAGIGFLGSDRTAYRVGESVPIAVKLRNVSSQPVTIKHSSARLRFTQPRIENAKGEPQRIYMPPFVRYVITTVEQTLAPEEEIFFSGVQLQLAADAPLRAVTTPHLVAVPGEYTCSLTVPLVGRPGLTTEQLKFVVKEAERPGIEGTEKIERAEK